MRDEDSLVKREREFLFFFSLFFAQNTPRAYHFYFFPYVAGPFSVNGVPLKRVNAAYVIATVTKVDLPKKLPKDIDDSYFAKEESEEPAAGEDKFFAQTKKTVETSDERKKTQEAFDKAIAPAVTKDEMLAGYLKATFTLSKGDKPHKMIF